MTRKRFSKSIPKSIRDVRSSFMFPLLHQDVSNAVSDVITSPWFNGTDNDNDSCNQYSTFVMGKFQCDNDGCSKNGWGSKKVAILIRGYPQNGYNAVVFGQRCQSCYRLGILMLDKSSYIDRVAYRLKKWAGVPMGEQHHSSKSGPPHKSELCEGCKRGYCEQRYERKF